MTRRSHCTFAATLALLAGLVTSPAVRAALPWTTTPLSAPALPAQQDVESVWISPDGKTVVYGVYQAGDGSSLHRELRAVRLDALSDPVSLTAGLSDAFRFSAPVVFAPDSRRVAFTVWVPAAVEIGQELWSAALGPGTPVPVRHSPLGAPQTFTSVRMPQFTPNGARLLFALDHFELSEHRIYSAPAGGPGVGATIDLGGLRPGESSVLQFFAPTADSQRVIFGRRDSSGFVDLVSVPVAGPSTSEIVLVEGTTADVEYPFLTSASTGGRVVYLWSDGSGGAQQELYSVPVAGPANQQVRLNPTLTTGGRIWDLRITPDATRVVYIADQATEDVYEVYSVPIAGPSSSYVRLNPILPVGSTGVHRFGTYNLLPDGSRMVYAADQEVPGRMDLWSVPVAGPSSAGAKLNQGIPSGSVYPSWVPTLDSKLVVFVGTETVAASGALHARPADGAATQIDLGCDFPHGGPIAGSGGVFANCIRVGEPTRELHHFRLSASPLFGVVTDVTSLDDLGLPVKLLAGPTRAGGVLVTHDSPAPGTFELFAADRRIRLIGFETGDYAGWSTVIP